MSFFYNEYTILVQRLLPYYKIHSKKNQSESYFLSAFQNLILINIAIRSGKQASNVQV